MTFVASASPLSQAVDTVIFDLGGVLIEFDFDRAFLRAGALVGLPPGEVRRRILGCAAFQEYECGRIGSREFHASIEQALAHALPYETFQELWNHIFIGEIAPTAGLVSVLRAAGLKVGVLSNTNAIHFEFLLKTLPALRELEHVYASHLMGCRKPEPAAYRHVLEKMSAAPRRAVFVDDLAENILGAREAGMHGVHAVDPAAVRAGLAALGLPTPGLPTPGLGERARS
jgi:putative hydrolase of the HAD superfamily